LSSAFIDNSYQLDQNYHYRLVTHVSDTSSSFSYPQFINTTPIVKQAYKNKVHNIPGVIQAEDFDEGGDGVSYYDIDQSNNGGEYRNDEAVDIEKRDDGGYQVGWTEAGEWMEYTVFVESDGVYEIDIYVAAMELGSQFCLHFQNCSSEIVEVSSTSSWQQTTVNSTKLALNKGANLLRIEIITGGCNIDKLILREGTHIGILSNHYVELKVFPNPAVSQITIQLPDDISGVYVQIFNLDGQVVKRESLNSKQIVDIGTLKKGCYIIEVKSEKLLSYKNKFHKI